MRCNQGQLAEIFGVTAKTVIEWQATGLPITVYRGKGRKGNEYDTVAVFRWLIDRERAAANPGAVDLEDAKTRLAVAQADRYEIENAESRGELLRADDVAAQWIRAIVESRAVLLAGPTRLAPLVVAAPDLAAARAVLQGWVDESLSRLSVGDGPMGEGAEGIRAAAPADGKRMGRPRKTAQSGSGGGTGTVAD